MDPKKNSEQWYDKLFRVINSAICFSLAYIVFTYTFWLVTAMAARAYKFDSFIYYYGIKFMINSHWDKSKIDLVYSAGPVYSLVFGLTCFILYSVLRSVQTLFNLFLLWGFVIGTSIFAAQGIIMCLGLYNYTSPFYQNFAVVLSWWRASTWVAYALCFPFALIFLYFSLNYGKYFLVFSYSFSKINKLSRRRKYFFETALVPFALGGLITTFITYPMNLQIHTLYLSVIGAALAISWYLLSYSNVLKYELVRYTSLQVPNFFFMLVLIVVCLLVYVTFGGIYFSPGK